jgi:dienelactone hydrolase
LLTAGACADSESATSTPEVPSTVAQSNVPSNTTDAGTTLPGTSPIGVTPGGAVDAAVPRVDAGPIGVSIGDAGVADASAAKPADGGTTTPIVGDAGATTTPVSQTGAMIRGEAPTRETGLKKGPYKVQSATQGFRDGPDFAESTLWWPEDAVPPFAFVAVVPGWVSTEADIRNWGPFLASHGIVTMTAGTNSPASDLPPDRAKALLDILRTISDENARAGAALNGKLDLSRQATMGWSMGGGGSLLAAEQAPTLKAAISLCGWNPDYKYSKVKVPALMMAATPNDALAGGQSQGFYDSIPNSTPKVLFEINNAGHWEANDPANQAGTVGLFGLSFLKVFLEGDERYRPFLKQKPAQAADFRQNL